MQLTLWTASALLAGLASAQSLTGLPSCAIPCVTAGLPSNCNLDPKCICSATSFITAISCCIVSACSPADQAATLTYAHSICDPVGVTTLPKSAGCSGSASGSATGSATGSAASSASSSAGSVSASLSSSVSSVSASMSSMVSSASESATSAASSASEAANSASSSGNAGETLNAQGLGAIGAALLGFAAML